MAKITAPPSSGGGGGGGEPDPHATTHNDGGDDEVTLAESQVTGLTAALAAKSPLASPTFTGTPAAPTAAATTNTTQLSTTAFVHSAVSGVVASTMSTVTVNNTASETDLVNLNVPTSVADGDLLRLIAGGTYVNSSGSNVTFTPKLILGSTTVFTGSAYTNATNANNKTWLLMVDIYIPTAASSQIITGLQIVSITQAAAFTAGSSSIGADQRVGVGTAAENLTTGPKALKFTITMGTANGSASAICNAAALTRLRA
jgi:hypothetical protein